MPLSRPVLLAYRRLWRSLTYHGRSLWLWPATAASHRLTVRAAVRNAPLWVMVSVDKGAVLGRWRAKLPFYGLAMLLPTLAAALSDVSARRRHTALRQQAAELAALAAE